MLASALMACISSGDVFCWITGSEAASEALGEECAEIGLPENSTGSAALEETTVFGVMCWEAAARVACWRISCKRGEHNEGPMRGEQSGGEHRSVPPRCLADSTNFPWSSDPQLLRRGVSSPSFLRAPRPSEGSDFVDVSSLLGGFCVILWEVSCCGGL